MKCSHRVATLAVGLSIALACAQARNAAASSPTGAPASGPDSPPAVIELSAGGAALEGDAFSTALDVESRPFISRLVSVRAGMSYVAGSYYRGANPSQLGASLQVAVGWSRVEAALGWIALQHADAYNSGRMNFDATIDIALLAGLRLRVQHWSNADSERPNVGRNMALLCYRF